MHALIWACSIAQSHSWKTCLCHTIKFRYRCILCQSAVSLCCVLVFAHSGTLFVTTCQYFCSLCYVHPLCLVTRRQYSLYICYRLFHSYMQHYPHAFMYIVSSIQFIVLLVVTVKHTKSYVQLHSLYTYIKVQGEFDYLLQHSQILG